MSSRFFDTAKALAAVVLCSGLFVTSSCVSQEAGSSSSKTSKVDLPFGIVTVQAGAHDRIWCPVEVKIRGMRNENPVIVELVEKVTGAKQIGTIEDGILRFVVSKLEAGKRLRYRLEAPKNPVLPVRMSVDEEKSQVRVHVQDDEFTVLNYDPEYYRPYFWPVNGPTVEGKALKMTRGYPMTEEDLKADHPHHRSLWTAYGNFNQHNAWHDSEGKSAWMRLRNLSAGSANGLLTMDIDWMDAADEKKVMVERREVRFYNTPAEARLMDYNVTLTAVEDVTFNDTKEGGFFSIRVNDHLAENANEGGIMTNSEGGKTAKECWGRRASWVDYSGKLQGTECGMTIFSHPKGFRHQPHWHARGYGLLTANVFGHSHFNKWNQDLPQSGTYTLKKGESIDFLYRFLVHSGNVETAHVAERYDDYTNPPKTRWRKE